MACFVDDDAGKHGNPLNEIPVMSLADAREKFPAVAVVGGVGNPRIRQLLMVKAREAGFGATPLRHPGVQMSRSRAGWDQFEMNVETIAAMN